MRKSILLVALVATVLFAPDTFAKGGKKQQNPKEKTAKIEKKEEKKSEQKVADNSKKHPQKKVKKAA